MGERYEALLSTDSFRWAHRTRNSVQTLPAALFGRFHSREDELRWFTSTIGEGRPWGVSEGDSPLRAGLPKRSTERAALEWDLHAREGTMFSSATNSTTDRSILPFDHFGLRRFDTMRTWKPIADTVPELDVDEGTGDAT